MVPSDLNPAAEAGGDKEKALKNDEVFGCARSVHFRDLENHHSEYHPLNYDSVVLVGPLLKIKQLRINVAAFLLPRPRSAPQHRVRGAHGKKAVFKRRCCIDGR